MHDKVESKRLRAGGPDWKPGPVILLFFLMFGTLSMLPIITIEPDRRPSSGSVLIFLSIYLIGQAIFRKRLQSDDVLFVALFAGAGIVFFFFPQLVPYVEIDAEPDSVFGKTIAFILTGLTDLFLVFVLILFCVFALQIALKENIWGQLKGSSVLYIIAAAVAFPVIAAIVIRPFL